MANLFLDDEYNAERKRIQDILNRGKRLGYSFDENLLPKIKHGVTQEEVNELRKITPTDLYRKSTFRTPSGEIISGETQRQFVKQQGILKAQASRKRNRVINAMNETKIPSTLTVDEAEQEQYNDTLASKYSPTNSTPQDTDISTEDIQKARLEARRKTQEKNRKYWQSVREQNKITNQELIEIQKRAENNKTTFEEEYFKYLTERDNQQQADYPTLKIQDRIRAELESISNKIEANLRRIDPEEYRIKVWRWELLNYPQWQSELLSLFDDLTNGYNNDENEVAQYLLDNETRIMELIEYVIYASDSDDNIRNGFNELAMILNGGEALTHSQAERMEETLESSEPIYKDYS